MNSIKIFIIIVILACIQSYSSAEFVTMLQGAAVYSSRNDVALPGDTGSRFSYTGDLDTDMVFSPRIEAGYIFSGRHYTGFMASLLRLEAYGTLDRNIYFDNRLFPAGTAVKAGYRFDSYRATYRYYFISNAEVKLGAGITGKIRDAGISLEGGGVKGGLSNTGFVPLINYYIEWIMSPQWSFVTYGDAAWSPYGRAEDIFAGIFYRFNDTYALTAGYRMLEGGADNDTVYTFAMFHYAVLGIEFRF